MVMGKKSQRFANDLLFFWINILKLIIFPTKNYQRQRKGPNQVFKGGLISEGILNLIPTSKKCTKEINCSTLKVKS